MQEKYMNRYAEKYSKFWIKNLHIIEEYTVRIFDKGLTSDERTNYFQIGCRPLLAFTLFREYMLLGIIHSIIFRGMFHASVTIFSYKSLEHVSFWNRYHNSWDYIKLMTLVGFICF